MNSLKDYETAAAYCKNSEIAAEMIAEELQEIAENKDMNRAAMGMLHAARESFLQAASMLRFSAERLYSAIDRRE